MVESKLPGTHIAARLSLWVSETQNLVFIDKISLKLVANVSVFFLRARWEHWSVQVVPFVYTALRNIRNKTAPKVAKLRISSLFLDFSIDAADIMCSTLR